MAIRCSSGPKAEEGCLRAAREHAAQPAERVVARQREHRLRALLEQLGQGVLEQRQAAGPGHRLGDELGDEAGLDRDAHPLGRRDHGRLQLARRHRQDVDDARHEDLAELGMLERPVVVVGPQREDHDEVAVRLGEGGGQDAQELVAPRLLAGGEELLELVEHDDDALAIGQRRERQVVSHLALADAGEDRPQVGEWVRPERNRRDHPSVGARHAAVAEAGEQAGGDDARLARAGRPDQADQPLAVGQGGEKPLDDRVAAEEVVRVLLAERLQALVRVAGRPSGGLPHRCRKERWIVEEHAIAELLEWRRWLEPELLDQQLAQLLVAAQRLGVAAGSVQRDHQQLAGALAQWILADGGLEQRHDGRRLSGLQLGGGQRLDCVEMQVVEAPDVGLRELLVRKVGERGATPQLQCGAQRADGFLALAAGDLGRSLPHQRLEAVRVDRLGRCVELVAGRAALDQAPARERLERLAQIRDVDLDRVIRRAWRRLTPEQLDQPFDGDDLADVEQQDGEQGALLRRAELDERSA